jgi:exonuclease SbcC
MVSDFRCIEGTRVLPFDAPVVLIHGPNGTGKTSVLAALEFSLTGAVRSMARQYDRYTAHLPFLGQPFATVRADVADYLQAGTRGVPMTVSGARIDGTPALTDRAAKFYTERCYLDQASLGRLLELYQFHEKNEESALAKFVNELLDLEKLDALRSGLSDANDLRLLKKLAVGVEDAAAKARAATAQLSEQSKLLAETQVELAQARSATREVIAAIRLGASDDMTDSDLLRIVRTALNDDTRGESATAVSIHQELIALGGRISALLERPTTQRIHEIGEELAAATTRQQAWDASEGGTIRTWEAAAKAAGAKLSSAPRFAVEQATNLVLRDLGNASTVRAQVESVRTQLETDRIELDRLQTRLSDAREQSSALVESLAVVRTVIGDNNSCPICDRDFTETGAHSLLAHVDVKLAELTTHGQQLVDLRNERDQVAARIARSEVDYGQLNSRVLAADEQQALEQRHATLVELTAQLAEVESAVARGADLTRRMSDLQRTLDSLTTASSEVRFIDAELNRYATLLQVDLPSSIDSLQAMWAELLERAEAEVVRINDAANRYQTMATESAQLEAAIERESAVVRRVVDLAQSKSRWEARMAEAKRRQAVAKEVHDAAAQVRTSVVQRVFTRSLNDVWKSVFTRLAPSEGFIPSFGIPTATKTALDIKLETTHRNGEASGPPQMMLSAGNLNTAALSLFLALHLAVQPVVPCLVFDDPVQAMDEVHVAQFAGLIRILAKQHDRQVVIAVHERELFDYLTLELSPAYEGDELITIELGERAADEDKGITRHTWTPDPAIAI